MTGIYKITNRVNQKFYIGQSKDIEKRWKDHKQEKSRKQNTILQRAFAKYGIENFDFEVLQECTKEELNELEVKYIAEFKAQGKAEYNIAEGGYGDPLKYKTEEELEIIREKVRAANIGKKLSEEHKRKIGESQTGKKVSDEAKRKISIGNTGKKRSEETKEKHKIAMNNRSEEEKEKTLEKMRKSYANRSKESKERHRLSLANKRRKVVCIETGEIFESIALASKIFGKPCLENGIRQAIVKPSLTAGGYHWRDFDSILDKDTPVIHYKTGQSEDTIKKSLEARKKIKELKMRKIVCVETGEVYESVAAAARTHENQASAKSVIRLALRENKHTGLGYHWRDFDPILDEGKPVLS
jgi:group I intron endonuclease